MHNIVDRLRQNGFLSFDEFKEIIHCGDKQELEYLYSKSREQAKKYYGNKIYVRGLIEFTNYCKNDCLYCGIRASNKNARRYRLGEDEILDCCKNGYSLGFRTFVLQGGEDMHYTDDDYVRIISKIKSLYPSCAVTLSIGERSRRSYERYFDAGADRYLLRHETADCEHYKKLHPEKMSFENRMRCIRDLKEIGYQTGVGIMVGSPYQTQESIYKDLQFIKKIEPQMVGIGPFIPHKDTPFARFKPGNCDLTLKLLAIIRLIHPNILLPATTALGTIAPDGRERGILAGANVVMPNLSPVMHRKDYSLYDNKICTGEEAAECRFCLSRRVESIGYEIVTDRGDAVALCGN
ncbi:MULTISPECIES: [FeFe] hydrogenase H-cluster radical SAM maturase HydE [unclassified Ruminococcus]|uniref:[FeFe] hydrogenase H-cluster radical SAM maturase HydE n=1 Tax=unclassified Ruminococcus TaxID=2608920 RepID=UPI00210DFD23|nr:[FeFe] hydrogenase H-cluster radical SAM maturase HydE [Ruminococcus sp. zg-924]MCQ4115616.1 [FeFe] hydrogenase H-cluster radical SAM maturase HydE [Ruminococcus sp. zg-921]